ncbi:hypothetical protein EMPS_02014 [Entomortierella parvispora]|uniref:Zn(2)-C6 fungal-type domain-containing protein n=1 Tax=Entomortierella parvispora TaxID=205924 RepID=A0A9P3H3Y0_9FUNG|nr:hypothetical protein EMPS_02014 [Entomortierella parvispora]
MAKKDKAAQRHQAEQSPSDSDDNDHDHDDHDEHEDHDDHEHSQDGSASTVKRKRLTLACSNCRRKKIKCDGVKPTCANCAKLGVECAYLPSMKKRGPRQGYIELLEKRLDKMEQLLQQGPGAAAVDPELLDSSSIRNSRLRPGNNNYRRSNSPDSRHGVSRPKEDPEERYFGTTAGYTSQHLEYDKQNDESKGVVGPRYSSQSTLPQKGSGDRPKYPIYGIKDDIPRKDILDHLIQLFFDSIYFQLPIIHPGTFMKQYKEGKVSPNLLNAMCAAVARFSNHPDVMTTPAFMAGEPFATNVRASLVDSIDIPTVSNVQALVYLSMYEYGAARGPRAWMFGGMALRLAQELGLNREDSSPVFYLKGDWVMRETRRRTFWACFMLDVLASSSSGRPRMMDERDCEVLLPSEDNDWYDERPVVTEMLDDDQSSTDGTDNERGESNPVAATEQKPGGNKDVPMEQEGGKTEAGSGTQASEGPKSTPSPKSKKQGGHVLSSFAYLIRIVAVLGKVSQYVNRPRSKKALPPNEPGSEFSIIDNALTAWHNSIPEHLAYSLENGKMVKDKGEGCLIVFMHVIYHTSVVLLHRPILAADRATFPIDSAFVENSAARCADAASKVSDVLEFVQAYNCPPRIFISAFFAYPVFTTATIHITNAFASDPTVASRARRSLSIHVKILQTMKSYWSMADKFFYIIRDLYSIQSKISSSASGVVVPKAVAHSLQGRSKKSFATDGSGYSEGTPAGGESGESADAAKNDPEDGSPPGMAKGKLASISSFLKSDSGLIALWRRATEMQSLDEANQEKRRLSASEESDKHKAISLDQMKELHPQDKELQEHRDRMNALEIQEINQEFDRRWRSKLEPRTELSRASGRSTNTAEGEASSVHDKRHKDDEDEDHSNTNPKGSKQMRTEKTTKAKVPPRKSRSTTVSGGDSAQENLSTQESSSSSSQKPAESTTYRHSIVLQPQQLQQADSYIMQPMQIQPTTGPQKPATDVNQQLLDLYAQQNQSIDMMQNTNIQRQQQLLMQQQQAAQMSSLAFGPPGGYPSLFMNNPGGPLQGFAPQTGVGTVPNFVPPLVYGSNYDNRQQARMPTESLGSLFDFALPQEDISFLSNSFQVTPMMMQENGSFTQQNAASTLQMGGNARPMGGSRAPGATMGDGSASLPPTAAGGMSSPLSTTSSGHRRNLSTSSQSPSTDTNSMFNLSPGLNSFMMSDENLMGAQATPNNLIRYLQLHHQQELQQHELQQQQDTQPLLNQQNSLIYDDYFPWSSFSTQQQPGL